MLQGGNCRNFEGAAHKISGRIKTLLQMAAVLTYGARCLVKMGRMAGQFSKPRSSDTKHAATLLCPSFPGETVNGFEFTPEAREHDPKRMLRGYHTSSATLNLVRSFLQKVVLQIYAQVHQWNRGLLQTRQRDTNKQLMKSVAPSIHGSLWS